MENKISKFPFVGKWYRVVNGDMAGFIGKCVSYDLDEKIYPVVLQDLNYLSIAVSMNEIEETVQQPDKLNINNDLKN